MCRTISSRGEHVILEELARRSTENKVALRTTENKWGEGGVEEWKQKHTKFSPLCGDEISNFSLSAAAKLSKFSSSAALKL